MENSPILTPKTSIPAISEDQAQEDRRQWAYEQISDVYDQLREWYADLGKKRGKWWAKSFRQVLASEHVGMIEMNLERFVHAVVNGQNEATRGDAVLKLNEGCAYLIKYVAGKAKIEGTGEGTAAVVGDGGKEFEGEV